MDSQNQDANNIDANQAAATAADAASQLENGKDGAGGAPIEDKGIELGFGALGLDADDDADDAQGNQDAGTVSTKAPDFTDLTGLIESGDKDKALARLQEIQPGIQKLARQAQDGQESVRELQLQSQLFNDVASGNRNAAEFLANYVQQTTGWTLREIADYVDAGGSAPQRSTGDDPRIAKLEKEIASLKGQTRTSHENVASAHWMNTEGKSVSEYVQNVTGRQYTPAQIWEARSFLKGVSNPTAAQIEKAIMKVNPDYYFDADNRAKASSNSLPAGTSVPRGSQPTKIAPADVMSSDFDRQHAERYRSQR